jgi:hypothetical protein
VAKKNTMRTRKLILLLLGGIIISSLITGGCKSKKPMQARQIPLEDFFKNPDKARYQISPDGK